MGFLTGVNKNTIQEFIDPNYGRKAETFSEKERWEMKAWADKELEKAKKDLADLKSGKKTEMVGLEDWTPQAIRAKENFISLLEDFNRKYKEIQAEAKADLAEAKKEQEEKPKKKAKPWVDPDLQKPKKSEKPEVKKEETLTPQKPETKVSKTKETPEDILSEQQYMLWEQWWSEEIWFWDEENMQNSDTKTPSETTPTFETPTTPETTAPKVDSINGELWTITSYAETPSSTTILWNGPSSTPSEIIWEREWIENGSLVFKELQEKILREANNPKVKLLTAISSIWVDWAKKAAESQTTFWYFDGEQKAINQAISDITTKLWELNSDIFNKDKELTPEDINNYISSIFAIMEKIEKGWDSLFEDWENVIDNLWDIRKLFDWATEENYEERLAQLLQLSAGWFRDWNTEKSKDIAKSIIMNKYFVDMSNKIDWVDDFSSMDDNFFMSITYGISHEDSKEMVEDVKATYKEVYNETAKHRDELEKSFLEQNPNFDWNLTETINRLISKSATIQSQKMAKYLFVQEAIESDTFNWDKDAIVDTFKELDGWWQDTKEFLADNWVAIAMSLIPLWAWFAAVWLVAKWASWASRWKTALDYWWKGQALINTWKWVVFYEWMNAMNTAMYGMSLEQFLEWATDGKELVKSALFFNAMWIVSKYVRPWDKFISAQNAKLIWAELWAFTWIDLATEFAFEWKMSVEQFMNSVLTWGIMTVLSRGAWKISPSMRGRFEDSKTRRVSGERWEVHWTGPYEWPATSVEFFRNKLTWTIYIKRPDWQLRYPNWKIARIKEENLQKIERTETTNVREGWRTETVSEGATVTWKIKETASSAIEAFRKWRAQTPEKQFKSIFREKIKSWEKITFEQSWKTVTIEKVEWKFRRTVHWEEKSVIISEKEALSSIPKEYKNGAIQEKMKAYIDSIPPSKKVEVKIDGETYVIKHNNWKLEIQKHWSKEVITWKKAEDFLNSKASEVLRNPEVKRKLEENIRTTIDKIDFRKMFSKEQIRKIELSHWKDIWNKIKESAATKYTKLVLFWRTSWSFWSKENLVTWRVFHFEKPGGFWIKNGEILQRPLLIAKYAIFNWVMWLGYNFAMQQAWEKTAKDLPWDVMNFIVWWWILWAVRLAILDNIKLDAFDNKTPLESLDEVIIDWIIYSVNWVHNIFSENSEKPNK